MRYQSFTTKQKRATLETIKSLKGLKVSEARQVLLECIDRVLDKSIVS